MLSLKERKKCIRNNKMESFLLEEFKEVIISLWPWSKCRVCCFLKQEFFLKRNILWKEHLGGKGLKSPIYVGQNNCFAWNIKYVLQIVSLGFFLYNNPVRQVIKSKWLIQSYPVSEDLNLCKQPNCNPASQLWLEREFGIADICGKGYFKIEKAGLIISPLWLSSYSLLPIRNRGGLQKF